MSGIGVSYKHLLSFITIMGTVKLTDSEAVIGIQRVSSHQVFAYAAVSVAVISRQMCRLWAIS